MCVPMIKQRQNVPESKKSSNTRFHKELEMHSLLDYPYVKRIKKHHIPAIVRTLCEFEKGLRGRGGGGEKVSLRCAYATVLYTYVRECVRRKMCYLHVSVCYMDVYRYVLTYLCGRMHIYIWNQHVHGCGTSIYSYTCLVADSAKGIKHT